MIEAAAEADSINEPQHPSLCGDCLRVRTFATWDTQEAAACECGADPGTFCMCEFCRQSIDALRAGARGTLPFLQPHVVVAAWSEARGMEPDPPEDDTQRNDVAP